MERVRVWMLTAVVMSVAAMPVMAQTAVAPAAHEVGTVKTIDTTGLTLTTAAGQVVTVTVPEAAKVLLVAPGSKDLKSATAGALSDVAVGDKVLVVGAAGDSAASMTASRVILMKAQAIAESHEADEAAWAKGGGGIVKSVDAAAGRVVIASGLKTVTVVTTPSTIVRRYAGGSVRFADAKMSAVGLIRPGDQLRVRGTKSADGSTITADELVTGSFHNYSGLIAAVDATAGTITLKDLTTKKTVTVAVTDSSDLRRIPPMLAQRVAAQMRGGGAAGAGHGGAAAEHPVAENQAAENHAAGQHAGGVEGGAERVGRAGMDLSQMLSRLPTETLSELKVGDAVMIVATSPTDVAEKPTAVTLLAGVEAILSASPSGQAMTLSPWSLGSGGSGGGGDDSGGGAQHAASPQ